jgi:hypothetical protein
MDRRTVGSKLLAIACGTAMGAALGLMSAWIVWEWIYGIGSRVVSDELFFELRDSVACSGLIVGAISGFLVATLLRWRELPPAIVGQHLVSVVAGGFGGEFGWEYGLTSYYTTHAAAVVVALGIASIRLSRSRLAGRGP